MHRRLTIGEVRWQHTDDFRRLAFLWRKDASRRILDLIWRAYDLLLTDVIARIDWSLIGEDLERQITQFLEFRIRRVMTGKEPFYVQHGPYEEQSRLAPPAQPPQYDIAFVWTQNERVMWPMEAKVLHSAQAVGEYLDAIRKNFLTGRYAPFSSEAAMLGYLIDGDPTIVVSTVATRLPCQMVHSNDFPTRCHSVSKHMRSQGGTQEFFCHHLVMPMKSGAGLLTSTAAKP